MSRLICTFSTQEKLEEDIQDIFKAYQIQNNKLFVLSIQDSNELLITYNIESTQGALLSSSFAGNRKKEHNVIYTINALNCLIMELNGGVLDKTYKLDWSNYRNMVMLTTGAGNGVRKLETKIYKIISK